MRTFEYPPRVSARVVASDSSGSSGVIGRGNRGEGEGVMRVMKRFHSNARPMGFDDDEMQSGKSMSGGGGWDWVYVLYIYGQAHVYLYYFIYIMNDKYLSTHSVLKKIIQERKYGRKYNVLRKVASPRKSLLEETRVFVCFRS